RGQDRAGDRGERGLPGRALGGRGDAARQRVLRLSPPGSSGTAPGGRGDGRGHRRRRDRGGGAATGTARHHRRGTLAALERPALPGGGSVADAGTPAARAAPRRGGAPAAAPSFGERG